MVKKENKLSWSMLIPLAFLLVLYQGLTGQTLQSTSQMFLYIFLVLAAIIGIIVELRKKTRLDLRREAVAQGELQQVKVRCDKFRDLHIQMAIILPIMGLVLWIGTFLYRSKQSFKVTEDGLTKRTLISKTTIRWADARLFAVHALTYPNITFGGTPDGIQELASNRKIIHWTIPQFSAPGLLLRKTSFETYQQQMQGLLTVIATKTGLTCYELNA